MTRLQIAVEEYVTIRRSLGFTLARDRHLLLDFVAFLDSKGAERITSALALEWATLPSSAGAVWWGDRLSKVRCFARYVHAGDPLTEVPPTDLLARLSKGSRRAVPYPYSDPEITSLLEAARRMRVKMSGLTWEALIGLLVVTGMRIGEAIALDRTDVDLGLGLLVVRHGKSDRSRQIPLHPSTVTALRAYARQRDERCRSPRSPSFFVAAQGGRLRYSVVSEQFRRLTRMAGIQARSPRCRPRIHDFRHSFTCRALEDWYRADVEVQSRLPVLSTYLGHANPSSTYWYLTARPELLALAAERLEASFRRAT